LGEALDLLEDLYL